MKLHNSTKNRLNAFVDSWQATTKSIFDQQRFESAIHELLKYDDSWYDAINYVNSLGKNGNYMWDWIETLNPPTQKNLYAVIEAERNLLIQQQPPTEKANA